MEEEDEEEVEGLIDEEEEELVNVEDGADVLAELLPPRAFMLAALLALVLLCRLDLSISLDWYRERGEETTDRFDCIEGTRSVPISTQKTTSK